MNKFIIKQTHSNAYNFGFSCFLLLMRLKLLLKSENFNFNQSLKNKIKYLKKMWAFYSFQFLLLFFNSCFLLKYLQTAFNKEYITKPLYFIFKKAQNT